MPAFSLKVEHNMKKNQKVLLGVLLLLFISFSISGCKSKSKEKPEKFLSQVLNNLYELSYFTVTCVESTTTESTTISVESAEFAETSEFTVL